MINKRIWYENITFWVTCQKYEWFLFVKLKFQEHSELKFVSWTNLTKWSHEAVFNWLIIPIAKRIGIIELNTPLLAARNKKFFFDTSTALLRSSSFLFSGINGYNSKSQFFWLTIWKTCFLQFINKIFTIRKIENRVRQIFISWLVLWD